MSIININNSNPISILFAGGPCAGKTTELHELEHHVNPASSYSVLFLPEAATALLKGRPDRFKHMDPLYTEYYIYRSQQLLLNVAAGFPAEKRLLLLCDRGTPDIYIYCSKEEAALITGPGVAPAQLLRLYSAVVYFEAMPKERLAGVLAADQAATPRTEDPDAVLDLDRRSVELYKQHPNFRSIPYFRDRKEKTGAVIEVLNELVGERVFVA